MPVKKIFDVVKNNWCVGCGMCAAVCPKDRLIMKYNERGEYCPIELTFSSKCGDRCGICYDVCPAHGNGKDATQIGYDYFHDINGIRHDSKTGYYLSTFLGYAKTDGFREKGSSGGMATWTLEKLIKDDFVDAVACVGKSNKSEQVFQFKICNSLEDIRKCGRSAYYPVEVSEVIRHIIKNDARYAIIGLPCVCKAIRRAQYRIPVLRKRIKFVIGIVCGRSASKFFLEYLVAKGGGDPFNIQKFEFRVKSRSESAKKTFGKCFFKSGALDSEMDGYVNFNHEWGGGYFKPRGCFFCDDIFAECADATFMDAWLKPYSDSPQGHNIIVTRNILFDKIYGDAKFEIFLNTINIQDTIQSQSRVIYLKRRRIWAYLRDAKVNKHAYPQVREDLIEAIYNPLQLRHEKMILKMADVSAEKWIRVNKDVNAFEREINPYLKKLIRNQLLTVIFSKKFPSVASKKVVKIFQRMLKLKGGKL